MHKTFKDFVNKKYREAIRQLGILQKIFEKSGLKVKNYLNEGDAYEDPYIFIFNPTQGSFDGIRIYKIGSNIAFRVQNQEDSHPYGTAYPIDMEDMFGDFLADEGVDEKDAGKKVMEAVVNQLKKFFEKSQNAEEDLQRSQLDKGDNLGNIAIKNQGTDYSSLIFTRR